MHDCTTFRAAGVPYSYDQKHGSYVGCANSSLRPKKQGCGITQPRVPSFSPYLYSSDPLCSRHHMAPLGAFVAACPPSLGPSSLALTNAAHKTSAATFPVLSLSLSSLLEDGDETSFWEGEGRENEMAAREGGRGRPLRRGGLELGVRCNMPHAFPHPPPPGSRVNTMILTKVARISHLKIHPRGERHGRNEDPRGIPIQPLTQ